MHILLKTDILQLYNKIIFLTRKKVFYNDFNVSDTFTVRIYLTFFHLSFILIRLKMDKKNKDLSQKIFDFFFQQIEANFREMGNGDAAVNKKMKVLVNLFYEILIYCQKWSLHTNSERERFLIKFFKNDDESNILVANLSEYFDNFASFTKDISLNSLVNGVFNFSYKE
tara:strand:+ start:885 stop:1391 length:507 start_codon:yes stop_codon:yes gene_type:complete